MLGINESIVIKKMAEALQVSEETLTKDSALGDFEAWDSLGHLSILSALDELFEGKVGSINEMATSDSIKKILNALRSNGLIE
jgi:acyl carrier protein